MTTDRPASDIVVDGIVPDLLNELSDFIEAKTTPAPSDGTELAAERAAARRNVTAPDGPFVIIPGIGMSPRYSRHLDRELRTHGQLYSLTLPGFGGIARPIGGGPLSVRDHAATVARDLDRRSVRRAVVIGHSMGAQIAGELARVRPDLVDRLVLAAPVVNPHRRTVRQQAQDLLHDLLRESPSAAALVIGDFIRTGPRWFVTELKQMLDYGLEQVGSELECPILVVRGTRDPISTRDVCSSLARTALAGRFIEIDGAAHVVQHTAARRLADEIVAFCRAEVA